MVFYCDVAVASEQGLAQPIAAASPFVLLFHLVKVNALFVSVASEDITYNTNSLNLYDFVVDGFLFIANDAA